MGRLDGRVAIVTGGSRGIGKAIVEGFAREGAAVVAIDRDVPAGEAAVAEIGRRAEVNAAGGSASFLPGDVTDEARVIAIVDDVARRHDGRLDIVVNNAAVQKEAVLVDQTVDDFHDVVNTNLLGTFLFSRAAVPYMLKRRHGVIINLSSVLGLVGEPLLPVYAATKAGILGFTRSVAATYADQGIRSVAICPGDVETELNQQFFASQSDPEGLRRRVEREYPMERFATPDEIAGVAVFLASDDAAFVTGSYVLVDGGILSRLYRI